MSATTRGIFHNLKESYYIVTNGEITLSFSSKVYMNKFLDRFKDERDSLRWRLRDNLKSSFNFDIISDISLYRTIEKRGEHGELKGVSLGWQQLDQYALRKMTEKNISDWQEVQRLR